MLFTKLGHLSAAVLVTAGQAMALIPNQVTPNICKRGLCGTTLPIVKTGPSHTYTILDPIYSQESGVNFTRTASVPGDDFTRVVKSVVTSHTTTTMTAEASHHNPNKPRAYSLTMPEVSGYGSHSAPTPSPESSAESTATATETSWVSATTTTTTTNADVSSTSLPALSLTSTGSGGNATTAETTPSVTSATLIKSTVPGLTVPSSSSETSSETLSTASPSVTPHTGSGRPAHGSPGSLVMVVMGTSLLSIALAFVVVG